MSPPVGILTLMVTDAREVPDEVVARDRELEANTDKATRALGEWRAEQVERYGLRAYARAIGRNQTSVRESILRARGEWKVLGAPNTSEDADDESGDELEPDVLADEPDDDEADEADDEPRSRPSPSHPVSRILAEASRITRSMDMLPIDALDDEMPENSVNEWLAEIDRIAAALRRFKHSLAQRKRK